MFGFFKKSKSIDPIEAVRENAIASQRIGALVVQGQWSAAHALAEKASLMFERLPDEPSLHQESVDRSAAYAFFTEVLLLGALGNTDHARKGLKLVKQTYDEISKIYGPNDAMDADTLLYIRRLRKGADIDVNTYRHIALMSLVTGPVSPWSSGRGRGGVAY